MRRGTVLLFAVVTAAALCLAPAAGATGSRGSRARVLVVDDDGHKRSCYGTRRPFRTIQAAVDRARRGDTIWVCPGLYEETVKVETKRLTIKGANAGRDATRAGRGPESIVTSDDPDGAVQLLADHITWDGFTIRGVSGEENGPGMLTSPDHSGYLIRDTIFEDNGVGLHLGSNGKHPTSVCRNRFVANNEFVDGGFGVFSDEGAQHVSITYNRFERHNGAGIFFADRDAPQHDVLIDHNKSVDDMSFATIFASSRVRLTHNSVRARVGDREFPGPASAIFVGARNDDVLVHKNKVTSASGNGIDVTNTGEPGNDPAGPTNVVVRKNKVSNAQLSGLHFGPGTADLLADRNTALDNGLGNGLDTGFDCQDVSTAGGGTAGTANTWLGNVGETDAPNGICGPPFDDPDDHGKGHGKKHKKKQKKHRPDPCACQRHPKAF